MNKIKIDTKAVITLNDKILIDENESNILRIYPDNHARLGYSEFTHLRWKIGALAFFNRWTPYSGDRAFFTDSDFPKIKFSIDFVLFSIESFLKNNGTVYIPEEEQLFLPEFIEKSPKIATYARQRFDKIFQIRSENLLRKYL